ncbi:C1 family peptidase [Labilibacter marinus]|uniref:C1 family peptidase n=1 Tax=Labilibacter marinus TaxID=1477105 RepID=UPI00094FCCDA|nr:C1 family peptidase [Labilibacter marinus]
MNLVKSLVLVVICMSPLLVSAQDFKFKSLAEAKVTPVKSQDRTGTCWAYSTISFIEAEIMKMGGPALNLSEMFIVKHAYDAKAKQYVLLHGMGNFSQGGQAHDVTNVIDQFGFVPEEDYYGKIDTSKMHNHSELASVMKVMLDDFMEQKNASPSATWYSNISSVSANYLGELPDQVQFNKRTYSPVEFAKALGIEKDNYIELSSYNHHPFYKLFDLEVPDNWSHDRYYNLPIDELMKVMKETLEAGYTFVWDGDVSEKFFSHKEGVALLPIDDSLGFVPQKEQEVSQEGRQEAFYSWQATDDHLMHIVGMAKDQNGTVYFKTKNSWGNKKNPYEGYLYMSEAYVRMNTVAIMLNKASLSKEVSKKLFK